MIRNRVALFHARYPFKKKAILIGIFCSLFVRLALVEKRVECLLVERATFVLVGSSAFDFIIFFFELSRGEN